MTASYSEKYIKHFLGVDFEVFNSLKELKEVKLWWESFLNIQRIQQKHPHVRFLWRCPFLGDYDNNFFSGIIKIF